MDKMDMDSQRSKIHTEETPLHKAIENGDVAKALELIPLTSNLDMPEPMFLLTPMHLAARSGYLVIVEKLAEAGSNPDARDDAGTSPLHKAADNGYLDVVKFLLSLKVAVNPAGFAMGMYTPLMLAMKRDFVEIAEVLLDAGADPYKKDKRGRNCFDYAEEKPIFKELLKKQALKDHQRELARNLKSKKVKILCPQELPVIPGRLPDKAAFFMAELGSGQSWAVNEYLTDERSSPGDTFLIVLFLLSLHTGAADDVMYKLPWDGIVYSQDSWNQDHILGTAFDTGCVWYFNKMVSKIGEVSIKETLDALKYGNCDLKGGQKAFWIDGNLKISPREQVEVLSLLKQNHSPFVKKDVEFVLSIDDDIEMPLGYSLKSVIAEGACAGWVVGVADISPRCFVFCLRITDVNGLSQMEIKEIARDLLRANIPLLK